MKGGFNVDSSISKRNTMRNSEKVLLFVSNIGKNNRLSRLIELIALTTQQRVQAISSLRRNYRSHR